MSIERYNGNTGLVNGYMQTIPPSCSGDYVLYSDFKSSLDKQGDVIYECNREISKCSEEIARLREALEEILEPKTSEYYTGIRCGVEDRSLQGDAYEAAEYGYDQGKEYCQFIAREALGWE